MTTAGTSRAADGSLSVRIALDAAKAPSSARGPGAERRLAIEVEFDVPPGVTVLFGPSGAGKSRTLACIAGLVRPDRGLIALGDAVWFDGERGAHLPIHERRVGFLFQSLALFPHMTGAENVAYGIGREVPRHERRAQALAMLRKMHVGELADRVPRTFSGGEAQRVALARAFAMRPRVVLLDEPFSALSRPARRRRTTWARRVWTPSRPRCREVRPRCPVARRPSVPAARPACRQDRRSRRRGRRAGSGASWSLRYHDSLTGCPVNGLTETAGVRSRRCRS